MNDHSIFVWWGIALALVALGITIYMFRHRWFDKGYKKGEAANPGKVWRENPPDSMRRDDSQIRAR